MKKSIKASIALILIITFGSACTSTKMSIDTDFDKTVDFSKYRTFSMYNLTATYTVNQFNAERIVNAIRNEMMKKGFAEDNNNPDLMVNAVSVLLNKQSISAITNYGGLYRPYAYWGGRGTATTTVESHNYKDGTLLIDVVDTKTAKMVWQGIGSAQMEKKPKNPEKLIKTAVTKIMAEFPSADLKK